MLTTLTVGAALVAGAPALGPDAGGTLETSSGTFGSASGQPSAASKSGPGSTPQGGPTANEMPRGEAFTLTTRCPAASAAPTAAQLNAGLANFHTPQWKWADGGVSAPLGDGRVIWLFGDTIRAATPGYQTGMASNSMLISRGACFDQALAPHERPVIPDQPTTAGKPDIVWPTSVASINHGAWDEVLAFGVVVRKTGGYWGFHLGAATLTRFVVPRGGAPQRIDTKQLTPTTFDENAIGWGTGVVREGDMLYLYGTTREAGHLGRSLYLARVRVDEVFQQRAWQYRAQGRWVADVRQAIPVLPATQGVSHIVGASVHRGKPVIVSKLGGDFGGNIGVWQANSFGEPFNLVAKYPRPYERQQHLVEYMPLVHPEFGGDGQILVSMSRNALQAELAGRDWALGRPTFFTLPMPGT